MQDIFGDVDELLETYAEKKASVAWEGTVADDLDGHDGQQDTSPPADLDDQAIRAHLGLQYCEHSFAMTLA